MDSIKNAYEQVKETIQSLDIDSEVGIYSREGNSGVVIGKTRDYPQEIGVEFVNTDVINEEKVELKFRRLVSDTDWRIDDDGFFDGDGCEVFVFREIDPERKGILESDFEKSEKL